MPALAQKSQHAFTALSPAQQLFYIFNALNPEQTMTQAQFTQFLTDDQQRFKIYESLTSVEVGGIAGAGIARLSENYDSRPRALDMFSAVKSVTAILGVSNGISSCTYNLRTGTIMTARNVSGAAGNLYELNIDGALLRTIANANFIDTEGVTWIGWDQANGADVFVVSQEDHTTLANESSLTLCRLTPAAVNLDRLAAGNVTVTTAYSGGNPGTGNLGLEGCAYDETRGLIYYTAEKRTMPTNDKEAWDNVTGQGNAKIFARTVNHTGTLAIGPEFELCNILHLYTGGVLTDIADMDYDSFSDTILLLAQESEKIVRIKRDGTVVEQFSFTTPNQAEGIAIHPDGTQIFIVGENAEFFRLQVGVHASDPLLTQRIYPTELASINNQTGTAYTLTAADNGKFIRLTNAGAITLTVPTGLPIGFSCWLEQGGAGLVTVTPSGTTINTNGGVLTLGAQWGWGLLKGREAANLFTLYK